MEIGDPFPDGESFEDMPGDGADRGASGDPRDPGDPELGDLHPGLDWDRAEELLRGWVPQEDRLWLHPSEVARANAGAAARPAPAHGVVARVRDHRVATGVVGTAALAVAVMGAWILTSTAASPDSNASSRFPIAATMTSLSRVTRTTPPMHPQAASTVTVAMSHLSRSVVEVLGANGDWLATGVVLQNGIAVTGDLSATPGTEVWAVGPDKRHRRAVVIGDDPNYGVGVIRLYKAIPAEQVTEVTLSPNDWVLMALFDAGRSERAGFGVVQTVGDSTVKPDDLLDTINVEMPAGAVSGGALVDTDGNLVGILAGSVQGPGKDVTGEFVPSWLALGIAQRMAVDEPVTQGWLGVNASNSAWVGVEVDKVAPDGAAARAGVEVGDTIVAVDGGSVATLADLHARLYLDPPGTRVLVTIERHAELVLIEVVLGAGGH